MRITATDAHLAAIYYEVLLAQARQSPGQPILYRDVLARAQAAHPHDAIVQAAIPISMGRRLDLVVAFARQHGLPPLTCIVVNDSGEPGHNYKPVSGTWQGDMALVAQHDWSAWQGRWDLYIQETAKAAVKLKRRKEQEARDLLHDAWKQGQVPRLPHEVKEAFVALLMDGWSVEDALGELGIGPGPA